MNIEISERKNECVEINEKDILVEFNRFRCTNFIFHLTLFLAI